MIKNQDNQEDIILIIHLRKDNLQGDQKNEIYKKNYNF
jgi:hypothetical protein